MCLSSGGGIHSACNVFVAAEFPACTLGEAHAHVFSFVICWCPESEGVISMRGGYEAEPVALGVSSP
jgi:hypothetical protein